LSEEIKMDALTLLMNFAKSRMGGGQMGGQQGGPQGNLLDIPQTAATPPGPQMQMPPQAAAQPQPYRMPGLAGMLPQGMQDIHGAFRGAVPAMQDRMMGAMPEGPQDFFRMLQQKRDAHGLGRPQRQQEMNAFNNTMRRF